MTRSMSIVALPLALATSEDSRYPGLDGASRDLKTRLVHGYMDHVLTLATERMQYGRRSSGYRNHPDEFKAGRPVIRLRSCER